MTVLLFYPAIAGWALAWRALFPKMRTGAALLCAFAQLCALAYTGVILLGDFDVTPYVLLFGGLALLASGGAYRLYLGKKGAAGKPFFTPTALLFLLLCVALTVILRGGELRWHDEYAFWARAPKELYLFRASYFNALTNMGNRDYIPLFAALQYCLARAYGFSNLALYAVIIACYAACLCALADLSGAKRWYYKGLFALLALMLIPCCHVKFCTSYLTPDGPLALLLACGLLLALYGRRGERADSAPVYLIALILPGVKIYAGLLFSLAVLLALFLRAPREKRAACAALGLACALFIQLSWSGYANYGQAMADYQQAAALSAYKGEMFSALPPRFSLRMLLLGNGRGARALHGDWAAARESLRVVARRLFGYASSSGLMPYWLFWVVSCALYAAFCALARRERKAQRRYTLLLLIASALYIAGFAATLLVQPDAATSTNRYLAVPLLSLWIGLLFFLFRAARAEDKRLFLGGLISLVVFLSLFTYQIQLLPEYAADRTGYDRAVHARAGLDRAAPLLDGLDADARVLLIDESLDAPQTGDSYAYAYLALPRRLQAVCAGAQADYDAAALAFRADAVLILPADENAAPYLMGAAYQAGGMVYSADNSSSK